MMYMLDTDICSYIMRKHCPQLMAKLEHKATEGHIFCISVVTYQELRFGAERVGSTKFHRRLDAFCERLDYIAEWTTEGADQFAKTQAGLFLRGKAIGFADAMIASHALILGATLVSNNQKHFQRVDGLVTESWVAH